MLASEIPRAHTPPGGYGDAMPPPVLAGCDEPLVEEAPDLRGLWRVVATDPPVESMVGHLQRVEQAGRRLVVTAGGVVHDLWCDGPVEGGVDDVTPTGVPINVVATYEDGVHVLRPVGLDVEVTRRLEGERMIWVYGPMFTATLERVTA